MGKFKVGDKVRILDGSKIKRYTGGWNKEHMGSHVGEVHKIIHIDEKWGDCPCAAYMLDTKGLCSHARWDERGLELVIKPKFKVGDKVRAKKDAPYEITKDGWVGRVISVYDNSIRVFGKAVHGLPKNDFYVNPDYFELIPDQKIVITTDGETTTAVLYNGKQRIKEAKAICAPSDKFNFNYGATLALDRLTGFVRGSVDITLDTRSQMDRFIAGEVAIEVPEGKTKNFLRECEIRGLKWFSGDLPTTLNFDEKYFICEDNCLFYSLAGRNDTDYIWETWDGITGKENLKKRIVDDVMSALEFYVKHIKDDLDD